MDSKRLRQKLLAETRRYGPAVAVFVVAAGIGVVTVGHSNAATYVAHQEAENGAVTGSAGPGDTAGASSNASIKFGTTNLPPTPPGSRVCPAFPSFPDASCTGVPSGYSLSPVSGNLSTTAAGQTIDGKLISGDLDIGHNNVTVTNTRVKGHVVLNGHTGLTLQDVDLGPDSCPASNNGGTRALNGDSGYSVIRTHIHNNGDDLMVIGGGAPVLFRDSLLDHTCFYPSDHLDAIQWYDPGGVNQISIIHNSIDVRPQNNADLGNSALFWADGTGPGTTLSAYNNRFAGGQVTTALYDAVAGSRTVLDLHDNVYVKNSYNIAACSFGSSVKSIAFDGTSGVKFANNTFDDGSAVSCN